MPKLETYDPEMVARQRDEAMAALTVRIMEAWRSR